MKADTYSLGSASATIELVDNVWLLGGFNGTETTLYRQADPYANPTILDGAGVANHVVTAENLWSFSNMTRLDGFIITGGNADGTGTHENVGGGLLVVTSTGGTTELTVSRCLFIDNEAVVNGGAISAFRTASSAMNMNLRLINCEFSTNAAANGGAIYNFGAAIYMSNCLFHNNTASSDGHDAEVCNADEVGITMIDCTFVNDDTVNDNASTPVSTGASASTTSSIDRARVVTAWGMWCPGLHSLTVAAR